ncbi:tyrosine-protein phosphatase [Paradesulfitobacterium aromaticivorans]
MQKGMLVDFHIHILPGLDDGACYWEESLDMAKAAIAEGTTAMVVSPHYIDMRYHSTKDKVSRKIDEFKGILAQKNLKLKIYQAAEVQLTEEIPRLAATDVIPTINNTNYMLIEFPFTAELGTVQERLDSLTEQGIIPVLVHPERYREVRAHPEWLDRFIGSGALTQVNAGSLLGEHGAEAQEFVQMLVRKHLAHLLGSDSHGVWQRKPGLAKGVAKIRQLAGEEWAMFMTSSCPQLILAGKRINAKGSKRIGVQ